MTKQTKPKRTAAVKFLAQFGLTASQVRKDHESILCDVPKSEVTKLIRRVRSSEKLIEANGYYFNPIGLDQPSWAAVKHKLAVFAGELEHQGYLIFTCYRGCAEAHVEFINQ